MSSRHPQTARQAALQRQASDPGFKGSKPAVRGRSQTAGRQRATGEQRLEQLARPKTAHWDKCKYVCSSLAHQWLLTHSLHRSLTHSLIQSRTRSFSHSLSLSLAHSLTHLLTHLLSSSPAHSLTRSLTHSLTHTLSFVHTHHMLGRLRPARCVHLQSAVSQSVWSC